MRSTSFLAFALCALSATVLSAPTPQLTNILGSVTRPGADNNNEFTDNGNNNGNDNGGNNSAGNDNGNDNLAGSQNEVGNDNTFSFPSLKNVLNEREAGLLDPLRGMTSTVGSVTDPTAGSGNSFIGNGNDNGNNNANGNSAGNNNGNNNQAGSGNKVGNGNSFDFGKK
ncbi:hypothetical protein CC86DRAFT_458997 [Ophiobolus disseminans]|uniref:Uncharacterized protein n=1 Tax=Ophiobolus disseminans TaxID=1469910 RepID=A0A6A6ZJV0_9PLEO|nr:hypothetical protein CC86DRAFT_458997 [Ophiobolus disseminans]